MNYYYKYTTSFEFLDVPSSRTYNTNGTSVLTTVNGPNGIISNAGTVSASASKLSVASGGKYQHAQNGETVPKATWNANSTCEITGVTTTLPSQLKLQSFGNFTWNCPNQTMTGSSFGTDFATITYPIQGNFTMQNTGTGLCDFTSTAQDNYINGNFVMSGGILEITHSGGANRTVYVGGNFSMTGGTLRLSQSALIGTLNIPGDFSHTSGTITETSSGSGSFVFSKSGTQTYTSGGTISNTINFTVNSGSTLQMADASTTVTGGGTFTLSSGATLGITSTAGITSSDATGNIQTTTRSFSTGANYTYNGSVAQVTGNGLPATVNNLTVNNSAGVTLSASQTVNGTLTLSNGNITTDSYTLSIGGSGTVSRTDGHVIGNLNKTYSAIGSKVFEVGTANGYSPVTINVTAGSGSITVKAVQGKHPNASGDNVLQRYWTLTKDAGITSTDLVFQYLAGDVVGNEASYVIGMYESSWSFPGGSVDPGTHTASIAGVTAFSDYTMGENTSLPVELTSFTISLKNNAAQLRWKTATEINNYGFKIERQFESESWQTLGFISGHGTVNTPQSYQFTDQLSTTDVYRRVISYRLCQIDRDGTVTYSPVVSVSPGRTQKAIQLMQNYPNPFSTGSNGNLSTNISFSLPYTQYVSLRVYDISGREVRRLIDGTNLDAGVHTVSFFGSDIPSGMYIYELQTENGAIRKTMLLSK